MNSNFTLSVDSARDCPRPPRPLSLPCPGLLCPTLWALGRRRGPASREEQVSSSVPALATATVSRSQRLLFPLRSAMETRGAPAAVERWGASDHQVTPDFQMSHYKNRTAGGRAGPHSTLQLRPFGACFPSAASLPEEQGDSRGCKYLLGLSGSDAPAAADHPHSHQTPMNANDTPDW